MLNRLNINLYANINMFDVYLYLVLILIIIVILYLTYDQIVLSLRERKRKIDNQTIPAIKCENYYFSLSEDQRNYKFNQIKKSL